MCLNFLIVERASSAVMPFVFIKYAQTTVTLLEAPAMLQ